MEEEKKLKKTVVGNSAVFMSRIRQWFKSKPLFQKVLIIFAGIGFLFVMYIISVLVRYSDSSKLSVSDNTSIQGKVIDQNGKPIDGAVIAAQKNFAVTNPDGTFTIRTDTADTLTVSAYGYESTRVSSSQPSVTLSSLAPGSVRIAVVGPENQELSHALVYRLNANTLEPVAIALTDQSGEAVFKSIPSRQAAFVVLHPDYGFGWLEISLDPGGAVRPVVRLEEIRTEKKNANNFFSVVHAQESSSGNGEQLSFKLADVTNVGDGKYQINMIGESRTFFSLSYSRKELQEYIDRVSQVNASSQFNISDQMVRAVNELVGAEQQSPLIKTVRITQGPSDTNYAIMYGLVSDVVVKTVKKTYEVEIEKPSGADVMGYIQQQYATTLQNGHVVTVTSWSQAQAKDLASVEQVAFAQANTQVCCDQANANANSGGTKIPSEVSSHEAPPSNLTLTRPDSKTEYLNYSHRTVNEMMGKPNLETVAAGILEQNPTLSFVDKTSGSSFSFLEIPPPNPYDAPPAFLLDFFENTADAQSTYLNSSVTYQGKWKRFMASIGSDVFQKEGRTPYQVYWDLKKDIGTSQAWRLEEEKRLVKQSGKQGSSQQDANQQSQQSVPEDAQDADQQSQPTIPSDQQDDSTQVTISESPDSEQDDQGQESGSTSQQSSGNGSKNSSSEGTYYGPGAVGSR